MAYTKEVTRLMPTANKIGFKLVIMNGTETIIDRDYWEEFAPEIGAADKVKLAIKKRMQKDIDDYKAFLALYNNAAYTTACTEINNALEL